MKPIKCFAVKLDTVLDMYKAAGFDVNDPDTEVPNVLATSGCEWFFSGDLIMIEGEYHEIVIIGDWFSWSDVESESEEEDDGELH